MMNAKYLVLLHGKKLIGKTIVTEAIGRYPGGPATVTEINPDPAAPEIVMQVENPSWIDRDDEDNPNGSIGIFDYEEVQELEDLVNQIALEIVEKIVREALEKGQEKLMKRAEEIVHDAVKRSQEELNGRTH